jgi:hypothetical protein
MATPSFGEKLKHERECRNTSIEEIAEQTKIALRFLQALEKDDFDELPGRAFGKFYIRAYAEVLKFDPEPLIVEYDREQAAANGVSTESAPVEPAKPRRVEAEIARWRGARRVAERAPTEVAEESQPVETADGEPSREVDEETPGGHMIEQKDTSMAAVEEAGPVPVFDQEDEAGGARYDEAAALASILGSHEATQGAWRRWRNILAVVLCGGLVGGLAWVVVSLSGSSDGIAEAEPSSVDREAAPLSKADTNQAPGAETVLDEPGSISTAYRSSASAPESSIVVSRTGGAASRRAVSCGSRHESSEAHLAVRSATSGCVTGAPCKRSISSWVAPTGARTAARRSGGRASGPSRRVISTAPFWPERVSSVCQPVRNRFLDCVPGGPSISAAPSRSR